MRARIRFPQTQLKVPDPRLKEFGSKEGDQLTYSAFNRSDAKK